MRTGHTLDKLKQPAKRCQRPNHFFQRCSIKKIENHSNIFSIEWLWTCKQERCFWWRSSALMEWFSFWLHRNTSIRPEIVCWISFFFLLKSLWKEISNVSPKAEINFIYVDKVHQMIREFYSTTEFGYLIIKLSFCYFVSLTRWLS